VLGQFGDVVGVDVSLETLCAIENRPELGLVQARADALPFRTAIFDIVALLAIVEHVEHDGCVLKESHRVACPQALQILLAPAFNLLWSHHDEANKHFRRYRAKAVDRLQVRAGWRVLITSYVNAVIFPGAVVIRVLQRILGRGAERQFDMGPNLSFLTSVLSLETWLILHTKYRLPFGVNLFSISRRDE
jgi:Methyltransferase domain